ncbi:acetate--CoA ligase family protein [Ottowia thiooxydans]|uniref:Acyl-CoA synthetase (NDP forming) n=1 Tax=Ottowia thiooxydans TaxID=219182 RepID=A0ABV2QF34_9BURK
MSSSFPADHQPHALDSLFHPRSVAVVGASSDPRKIGGRPIAYMLRSGFAGELFPINPAQAEVQGVKAYPSLRAIGKPVDLVIVAVGGAHVAEVVDEAIEQRVSAIVVFSSGFAEMGDDGRQLQERIAARCAQAGVHLLGPNCIGVFNSHQAMYATFITALEHEQFEPGHVGIVSQSGAIGSYLYGLAGDRGVRVSHFVATGNEAGLDVADCIDWMANDPQTHVVMVYLEGCRDGDRLYRALEQARLRRKPVILMKVGRTEQGAAAAASHTGSLAGSDVVYDAVLSETNAWRANSLEEMVDLAYACSVGPMPRGNRLGVVTSSGGVGVIATDEATRTGLVLPTLPQETQTAILEIVPFASGVNPVDTTAQTMGDRTLMTRILELVFAHPGFDSVLTFNANMGRSEAEFGKIREALYQLRREHPDRLVAMSMRAKPEIAAEIQREGILVFSDPARATATIAAVARIAAGFDRPPARVEESEARQVLPLPAGALDEAAARTLLAQHGIPFAPLELASTTEEAVAAAQAMGYPVVMKVVSPDIPHKSDVGGVALGLRDAEAVRTAWAVMMESVGRACPQAQIDGVMVSPMITGGVETVMGVTRDPVFGPMVMFGLGGVFVEVFKDVTFRRAPVSLTTAHEMIRGIQGLPLLTGARGKPTVDLDTLASALVALSNFAAAHAGELDSVEINPFIARPSGGCAVDALIVKR